MNTDAEEYAICQEDARIADLAQEATLPELLELEARRRATRRAKEALEVARSARAALPERLRLETQYAAALNEEKIARAHYHACYRAIEEQEGV